MLALSIVNILSKSIQIFSYGLFFTTISVSLDSIVGGIFLHDL